MSDYENCGAVSANKHKTTDKHPDIKGIGNYDGTEFQIAGWKKTREDGSIFYSLKFSPKYVKPVEQAATSVSDDEIQF